MIFAIVCVIAIAAFAGTTFANNPAAVENTFNNPTVYNYMFCRNVNAYPMQNK